MDERERERERERESIAAHECIQSHSLGKSMWHLQLHGIAVAGSGNVVACVGTECTCDGRETLQGGDDRKVWSQTYLPNRLFQKRSARHSFSISPQLIITYTHR